MKHRLIQLIKPKKKTFVADFQGRIKTEESRFLFVILYPIICLHFSSYVWKIWPNSHRKKSTSILSNGCSSKIETGNVKNFLFMIYTCTNLKSTNCQKAYLKAICIWFLRREFWFCFQLYPLGFGSISSCKQIWKR